VPLLQPSRSLLLGALALAAPGLVFPQAVQAGPQLEALTRAVTPCIALGRPGACPAGVDALQQLRGAPAYARADRYCREQVTEFGRVLALLPMKDVIPQTVQGSLDGLVQACSPFGL
jgi:hypothetical protein